MTTVAILKMAAAILCFCIMVTCILWAVVISLDRVEQVNARLPAEEKIGFTFGIVGPSGIGDLKKNTKDSFQIARFVEKNESFGSLALCHSWAPYSVGDKFIKRVVWFPVRPKFRYPS